MREFVKVEKGLPDHLHGLMVDKAVFCGKFVQMFGEFQLVHGDYLFDDLRRETIATDACALEDLAHIFPESIDTGGYDTLHRTGELFQHFLIQNEGSARSLRNAAGFRDGFQHFSNEKRVALGVFFEFLAEVRREIVMGKTSCDYFRNVPLPHRPEFDFTKPVRVLDMRLFARVASKLVQRDFERMLVDLLSMKIVFSRLVDVVRTICADHHNLEWIVANRLAKLE